MFRLHSVRAQPILLRHLSFTINIFKRLNME
jgi:hypothetical protein